ncbi:MAG: class I SAM-dependent methyltransferase [Chloroflexia bacterium]
MSSERPLVEAFYHRDGLEDLLLEALQRAGKELDALRPEDLAPIDAFHVRGREATAQLARLAEVTGRERVLDVGCGLGGAARQLAELGCRVVGADLTENYCRVAARLSTLVGLVERTLFCRADAVCLPFGAASFDLVWTEHTQMNVADKERFYGEIARVLRPGGRLAFYDILQGSGGPPYFPVPWAADATTNFLLTPDALQVHLESAGFDILVWKDGTEEAIPWFRELLERGRREGRPVLGLHLLIGPDARLKSENQLRNLAEGRIRLVQGVAVRR